MENKVIHLVKDSTQKEPTAKAILQEMYELTQAQTITDSETGKLISVRDAQDLFFTRIDMLAELLGVDLEG